MCLQDDAHFAPRAREARTHRGPILPIQLQNLAGKKCECCHYEFSLYSMFAVLCNMPVALRSPLNKEC